MNLASEFESLFTGFKMNNHWWLMLYVTISGLGTREDTMMFATPPFFVTFCHDNQFCLVGQARAFGGFQHSESFLSASISVVSVKLYSHELQSKLRAISLLLIRGP